MGHPPFETATLKETYIRITDNRYTIPDWVSTQAKNLITKCLNHEPERRPSLDDVLADEFFSCGYFPNRLSGSCCTSIPRFPSQSHNRINRFVPLYFHSYSQGCGNSMCGSRGGPDPTGNITKLYVSLTHISLASFLWDIDKQCRPRSDATQTVYSCTAKLLWIFSKTV